MSDSEPTGANNRSATLAWGGIFAGALVAVVALVVLGSFGTAVGTSLTHHLPSSVAETILPTAIAACIALFVGGWAMSQCVRRETRVEAAFYGIVLWGLLFVAVLLLNQAGVTTGFDQVMGAVGLQGSLPHLSSDAVSQLALDLGLTPEQLTSVMHDLSDLEQQAPQGAGALWLTFVGICVSVAAVILGSIAGSAPRLSLRGLVLGRPSPQ